MNVLEVEIDQDSIVASKIDGTQRATQVALGMLVKDPQVEIDLPAQMLIHAGKVGLPPCGTERQDLHLPCRNHRRSALRL
ncbi:hypothetical protein D9M69_566960 [compost metagenome]